MFPEAIAKDPVHQDLFSSETLQKIEQGVIIDISDGPVNTDGAYGDLFSGYHTVLGLKVAMKRPRGILRRALREGHTWTVFRDIQHPNILPFLGVYEHGGYQHLVSPFMENGTLDIYLSEHPEADRTKLLRQAAGGLAHMHGLKIVHGDIKANNILVTTHGRVFLCDFGLSQMLDLRSVKGAYSITSLGNLHWASPELIEVEEEDSGNVARTFESDVWAFGMTIYQVLSGKLPYSGKREYGIIKAVLAGSLPKHEPLSSPSGVPYDFIWEVSSQCLRKYPSERISMLEAAICLGDNYDREVSSFEKTVKLERTLLADHPKHGMVVLKRFRRAPNLQENGLPRSDFQVELWASLRHPNILPFLGVCVVGLSRRPFLMSFHMEQGTIQDYVAAHPEKSRMELLCQAAQGLLYLHEELIVHGEVRADNLLMSGAGRVLLSGFGSSALIGGQPAAATSPPAPTKLARWNSPEVLRGGSKTFASDVYAFGMTIYEVLSGKIPFVDLPTDEEVVISVLNHDSRPPYWGDAFLTDHYEGVWAVVGRCWIPKWSDRPLMTEVIHELRKTNAANSPTISSASVRTVETTFETPVLSTSPQSPTKTTEGLKLLDDLGRPRSKEISKETMPETWTYCDLSAKNKPLPHLQNGSSFLYCPYEVVVKILATLSGIDLISASSTCRFLQYLVRDAAVLQYHIELLRTGLVDELVDWGSITFSDRLHGIWQWENRWKTLSWRRSEMWDTAPEGTLYDTQEDTHILLGTSAGADSLYMWQLPSLWNGRTDLIELVHKHIGITGLKSFKTDNNQDLLILSGTPEFVVSEEAEQTIRIPIHVKSLSGNCPHPSAALEMFYCEFKFADIELPEFSYSLRIAGDLVAIATVPEADEGIYGDVIICRWTDGVQLLVLKPVSRSAEFLSETTFVTAGVDSEGDTVLNVYELSDSVLSIAKYDVIQPSLIFKLPRLKGGDRLPGRPFSRASPEPGGRNIFALPQSLADTSTGPCAPPAETFGLRADSQKRIIAFEWRNIALALVVHASTLLDHWKSRKDNPTTFIPWHKWSHRTRWLPAGCDYLRSFGQRYAGYVQRIDPRGDGYLHTLKILDFNPYTIFRAHLLSSFTPAEQQLEGDDGEAHKSYALGSSRSRLVTRPTGIESDFFDVAPSFSLPYLETSMERTGTVDDVMITGEHIVVIKNATEVEVFCF